MKIHAKNPTLLQIKLLNSILYFWSKIIQQYEVHESRIARLFERLRVTEKLADRHGRGCLRVMLLRRYRVIRFVHLRNRF